MRLSTSLRDAQGSLPLRGRNSISKMRCLRHRIVHSRATRSKHDAFGIIITRAPRSKAMPAALPRLARYLFPRKTWPTHLPQAQIAPGARAQSLKFERSQSVYGDKGRKSFPLGRNSVVNRIYSHATFCFDTFGVTATNIACSLLYIRD